MVEAIWVLTAVSCLAGGCCGGCLMALWARSRDARKKADMLRQSAGRAQDDLFQAEAPGLSAWVLQQVRRESQKSRSVRMRSFLRTAPLGIGLAQAGSMLARAGMPDVTDQLCLRAVRLKLGLAWMALGLICGSLFSYELSCVLALVGLALGYASVPWALRREADVRNAGMERHLSEMVEVVILGLRSGLSFERSFALYPRYFDTGLGRSMRRAADQWEMGLMTREEALRRLEGEYNSALLSRVIGNMVRSLRFGTSIAEALEASAVEAREVHRARMEERVAKVAVKMMLPVGTLILPAMLLLVLGPVLLELVEGF